MEKKSQLTLFITIGLVFLLMIGIMFGVATLIAKKQMAGQVISPEPDALKDMMHNCLRTNVRTAVAKFSVHKSSEPDIQRFVARELPTCLESGEFEEKGLDIVTGQIRVDVEISDASVFVSVSYPIEITSRGSVTRFASLNFYMPKSQIRTAYFDANGLTTDEIIINTADGRLELMIPKGSQISDENGNNVERIVLSTVDRRFNGLSNSILVGGVAFEGPAGVSLPGGAVLHLRYRDEEIAWYNERYLSIAYWDPYVGLWKSIPSTVNTEENIVTATLYHFSVVGIIGVEKCSNNQNSNKDNYPKLEDYPLFEQECGTEDVCGEVDWATGEGNLYEEPKLDDHTPQSEDNLKLDETNSPNPNRLSDQIPVAECVLNKWEEDIVVGIETGTQSVIEVPETYGHSKVKGLTEHELVAGFGMINFTVPADGGGCVAVDKDGKINIEFEMDCEGDCDKLDFIINPLKEMASEPETTPTPTAYAIDEGDEDEVGGTHESNEVSQRGILEFNEEDIENGNVAEVFEKWPSPYLWKTILYNDKKPYQHGVIKSGKNVIYVRLKDSNKDGCLNAGVVKLSIPGNVQFELRDQLSVVDCPSVQDRINYLCGCDGNCEDRDGKYNDEKETPWEDDWTNQELLNLVLWRGAWDGSDSIARGNVGLCDLDEFQDELDAGTDKEYRERAYDAIEQSGGFDGGYCKDDPRLGEPVEEGKIDDPAIIGLCNGKTCIPPYVCCRINNELRCWEGEKCDDIVTPPAPAERCSDDEEYRRMCADSHDYIKFLKDDGWKPVPKSESNDYCLDKWGEEYQCYRIEILESEESTPAEKCLSDEEYLRACMRKPDGVGWTMESTGHNACKDPDEPDAVYHCYKKRRSEPEEQPGLCNKEVCGGVCCTCVSKGCWIPVAGPYPGVNDKKIYTIGNQVCLSECENENGWEDCKPVGESCTKNTECCSEFCNIDPNVLTCTNPPPGNQKIPQ